MRLALARYQPKSVKGEDGDVKLSRVVLADFAQLAPDRSVTLTYDRQDKKRIAVSVAGPSYLLSAGGRGPGTVEVVVEQKTGAGGGTPAWVPIPDSQVTLKGAPSGQGGVVWSGEVILPGDRGGGKYRLAIREYETLLADAPPKPALVAAGPALEPAQRLAFADVLEV